MTIQDLVLRIFKLVIAVPARHHLAAMGIPAVSVNGGLLTNKVVALVSSTPSSGRHRKSIARYLPAVLLRLEISILLSNQASPAPRLSPLPHLSPLRHHPPTLIADTDRLPLTILPLIPTLATTCVHNFVFLIDIQ